MKEIYPIKGNDLNPVYRDSILSLDGGLYYQRFVCSPVNQRIPKILETSKKVRLDLAVRNAHITEYAFDRIHHHIRTGDVEYGLFVIGCIFLDYFSPHPSFYSNPAARPAIGFFYDVDRPDPQLALSLIEYFSIHEIAHSEGTIEESDGTALVNIQQVLDHAAIWGDANAARDENQGLVRIPRAG